MPVERRGEKGYVLYWYQIDGTAYYDRRSSKESPSGLPRSPRPPAYRQGHVANHAPQIPTRRRKR